MTPEDRVRIQDILDFWFAPGRERQWFGPDPGFDAELAARFALDWQEAELGRRDHWLEERDGALALVILLDQIPRNIFRDSPRAYATDAQARRAADAALARGFDQGLEARRRTFLYLPFEHSEDLADQRRCCALFAAAGDMDGLHWAEKHKAIIERFGRFPHRNAILGRVSTPEEAEFLKGPGSRF